MKYAFEGKSPQIDPTVFVAPTAAVIGDVTIGPGSSIWFGAVLRGDFSPIVVGALTCLQDNVVVHARTVIGDGCTVGHGAVLHGCTIGNGVLVGTGALIFDGCVIEDKAVIAMGAVLTPNTHVPAGTVVAGLPARPIRQLTPEQLEQKKNPGQHYQKLASRYLEPGGLEELE